MTLLPPSPDADRATNYARLAAVITSINDMAAVVADLPASIDARASDGEAEARDLVTAILFGRPGLSPRGFTEATVGSLAAAAPLNPGRVVSTPLGAACRIVGAGRLAPRATTPVDPDAFSVLRVRYWRTVDASDPSNDGVDVAVQWLDAANGDLGSTFLRRERDLRVQDGPQFVTFRVPSLAGSQAVIQPPRGAVSWRPYVQTYGIDGETAVAVLGAADASLAGVYAPDVIALADRMRVVEGFLDAGLPLATPILPSCATADLPPAGTRGRKIFVTDGRAPDAAGSLEGPNAGTGVEATDNGVRWVITGTNQQVQA